MANYANPGKQDSMGEAPRKSYCDAPGSGVRGITLEDAVSFVPREAVASHQAMA